MTPRKRADNWIKYNKARGRRPFFEVGAAVTTSYIPAERNKRRTVARIYPAPHACQTGWHVETCCGLDLDSGWFKECPPELLFF
jgi:hypothetical protein